VSEDALGLYHVEWLAPRVGVDALEFEAEIAAALEGWLERHPEDEVVLFPRRASSASAAYTIVWRLSGLPRLDRLRGDAVALAASRRYRVSTLLEGGLYRDFGDEQL